MKAIKLSLGILLLFNAVLCFAEDTTTARKSDLTTLGKSITDTINKAKLEIHQQIDSANKTSQSDSPDSSFFNAWKLAIKNPCYLYNYYGECKKCTSHPEVCDNKYDPIIKWITWLLIVVFLFYAIKFFRTTALCRDESYQYDSNDKLVLRPEKERPYSYARTQLFWWSIIICTCYAVFFALHRHLLPLNPTCIILLGGGLVTQLLGKTIDKNQIDKTVAKNDATTNSSGQQSAEADTPKPVRHQDTNATKDFLTDILSDENGISIHRLQSVMFNMIYGIAFISYFVNAINCCEYPLIEFEGWQLTLLGISVAGYLGVKTTENSKATEQARESQKENTSAGDVASTNIETTPPRNQDSYQ